MFLASRSPQRAMLLRRANIHFTVVETHCDEDAVQAPRPDLLALERARAKAHGAILPPGAAGPLVALGADTVAALGNTAIGTPIDRADARRLLGLIQGTTHSVYTGHCCVLFAPDGAVLAEASRLAVAQVTMRRMSPEEIDVYVDSGESDGRAGAYAIQESADRFVVDLRGGWDTVVGLHVGITARLYHELTERWPEGYTP